MGFAERFKKGWKLLVSPSKEAKGNYSIGKSLKFYYTVAVFGFVFAAIVASLLMLAGSPVSTVLAQPLGTGLGFALIWLALLVFVMVPVGIFVNAAIYHLIGKFFLNAWKGLYNKTFAAATAAVAPITMLYWLFLFPVAGIVFAVIFGAWEAVILVIALSVQQKTTRVNAAVVLGILAAIVIMALMFTILGVFSANALALSHISAPGLI